MAANPPLTQLVDGTLAPTVNTAASEALVLARGGVRFTIDNVRTPSKKWASVPGTLYLTTSRLVFIAAAADPSGLVAFALPLASLSAGTDFVQPLFAANNLKGSVAGDGGEAHKFKLEFKEGGTGTFLPLYFNLLELNRILAQRGGGGGGGGGDGGGGGGAAPAAGAGGAPPPAPAPPKPDVATAFVDPSDPTKLFLTEPATKQ